MAERKVSKFETRMEQFGAWIEKYVAPPLVKFGNQRHMGSPLIDLMLVRRPHTSHPTSLQYEK